MTESSSHRQILRSISVIGGASVINILIGLLRTKVAAVLLGPAGIGLIGLLQNLIATAAVVAAMGFGNVGTRQIAEAAGRQDPNAVAAARRALFWGTALLSVVGAVVFWALRGVLAKRVLGDSRLAGEVGWLALGVLMTVTAGSQGALLNGLRRIGDIARVSVFSAMLSTVMGIGALMIWGRDGLLVFVLAIPLTSLLLGYFYVARLPKVDMPRTPLPQLLDQWRTLIRLGVAFMVAGIALTVGQLVVRAMVQQALGADALGNFQAAWLISMTYVGFVLNAMGSDYYPRLTAVINDHAAVNRLVNEQTEVTLLLAGPVVMVMLGLAPWAIDLLYSSRFAEAVTVLRWQVLGDILKVVSWPLGYMLLASGNGRTFMWTEAAAILVFIGISWIGLPLFGLQATGMAFLGMYGFYLPLVYWLATRGTQFRWETRLRPHLMLLFLSAIFIHALANWSVYVGAILGIVIGAVFASYAFARLAKLKKPTAIN